MEKKLTFEELFANTGIKPTTDENGGVHYNFNATLKNEDDKPFVNTMPMIGVNEPNENKLEGSGSLSQVEMPLLNEEKETYLMDTPIQELIDWFETRDMSNYQNKYAFKQAVIAKLKQTIEKEKREIIYAYENGFHGEEPLSGLAYYNENYENK